MANPNMILFGIAAGVTPVAIGAHIWALVQASAASMLVADLLDTATVLAWMAFIASWYTARVVTRINELERAHSVRIYADAVTAPAGQPDGKGRLRGLM